MVKKIEYIETPFAGKDSSKIAKFAQDIRDIIDSKIEYAELVDMPYADSTANQDLGYKARKICREYCREKYYCNPETTDFFKFAKQTKEDGVHWYVQFNVAGFERMVSKCLKNS